MTLSYGLLVGDSVSQHAGMLIHPFGGLMFTFFRRRPSRNARRVIAYLEAGRAGAR